MLSLTPIIQRLTPPPTGGDFSAKLAWFRQVEGAAEFARSRAAMQRLPLPGCWVARSQEKTDHADNEGRAEDVAIAFDVIIAVDNVRMQTAGDSDDILLAYRSEVFRRLAGWYYGDGNFAPTRYAGGSVIEYTDGDLWWRDRYEFSALLINDLPDPERYDSTNRILLNQEQRL